LGIAAAVEPINDFLRSWIAIVEGLIAQGHSARQHAAEQVWPDPTCNTVAEGGCPIARPAV
jgi:hypothetical protein